MSDVEKNSESRMRKFCKCMRCYYLGFTFLLGQTCMFIKIWIMVLYSIFSLGKKNQYL